MSSDTESLTAEKDSQPNSVVDGDWICSETELVYCD